jgi:8-oxo-dGTP diphosphatase
MSAAVIAAGLVIWRKSDSKDVEIAVVHRPRYNDWSIPKGKLEVGEALLACAYREGQEETGLNFSMGPFIGETEYVVTEGIKKVSYWAARASADQSPFHANDEVDQLQWWTLDQALESLTRDSDKEIVAKFMDTPFEATPLVMLRHAKALAREEWHGEDEDRPLDNLGQIQAKRMLSIYQAYGLQSIVTSDAVRCYDTVLPMARALGIEPVITKEISEYTFKKDKDRAKDYIRELASEVGKESTTTLICSHNPVLPKMLEKLLKKSELREVAPDLAKLQPGDAWVVFMKKKKIAQIDSLSAPTA